MAKAATTKKATKAKAAKPAKPEGEGAEGAAAPAGAALKKRELVAMVAQRSGVKKKSVNPVVEAFLGVLGEALAEGRDINLPPLGKIKVSRTKQVANGRVVINRIRQKDRPVVSAPDPLAEAAE